MHKISYMIKKEDGFKVKSYDTARRFLIDMVIQTKPLTFLENGIVYELYKEKDCWRLCEQLYVIDNFGGVNTEKTRNIDRIAKFVYRHRKEINNHFFTNK